MPDETEWRRLIEDGHYLQPIPVRAHTYHYLWETASRPVLLACDGGDDFVVKGDWIGRSIVNEFVVASLGKAIAAPVGDFALVEIPQDLIDINSEMSHLRAGVAFGCKHVQRCSECRNLKYQYQPQNRLRYAMLAVLYGWIETDDHQFFIEDDPPHLVHSFDHGRFFPSGPDWEVANLLAANGPEPDKMIVEGCYLVGHETKEAIDRLGRVTPEMIGHTVGGVPPGWGDITDEDRLCLAKFLHDRCEILREFGV